MVGREGQGALPTMVPDAHIGIYTTLHTPGYTMVHSRTMVCHATALATPGPAVAGPGL